MVTVFTAIAAIATILAVAHAGPPVNAAGLTSGPTATTPTIPDLRSSSYVGKRPHVPTAQGVTYKGAPHGCGLDRPSFPMRLDSELSVWFNLILANIRVTSRMEVTLQLRTIYIYATTAWNALTPFHPTAMPHSYQDGMGLPFTVRYSGNAASPRQKNTALVYAILRVTEELQPEFAPNISRIARDLGLDPVYNLTTDPSNPADIGNIAAKATLAVLPTDGWNQLGDMDATTFRQNFSDWKDFMPTNTPYALTDFTKWQPLLETNGIGYFTAQHHITPQAGFARPFALNETDLTEKYIVKAMPYPAMENMTDADLAAYIQQADEVLADSAGLTDRQKMLAEFFDQKHLAFGYAALLNYGLSHKWNIHTALGFEFHAGALYDATIVAWKEKIKVNAVRPMSAIRYVYADSNVTAWAGPYQGTKTFPGSEFTSYLRTMPHTDYPSGTACICVAWAEFTEAFMQTPGRLDYSYTFNKGCSRVEPGAVPAEDLFVSWGTTEEFIKECTQTRRWAGVHFQRSIDSAVDMCRGVGYATYNKYKTLLG